MLPPVRGMKGREPGGPSAERRAALPGRAARVALFVLPFVALVACVLLKLWWRPLYERLCVEDGPIENAQAVLFLASSLLAAGIAYRLRRRHRRALAALYVASAAGLFFVFGEEVDWGQRLLGFASPEFFRRYNDQGEVTLHNLAGMSYVTMVGYVVLGSAGAFGWVLARRVDRLGLEPRLVVPDWYIAPWFLPVAVTYAALPLAQHVGFERLHLAWLRRGAFLGWRDQEPAELMLAAGIALFLLLARSRIRGKNPERRTF